MQLEWAFRNYIIIKLDTSPNSTHVNVFEMAGIDPKQFRLALMSLGTSLEELKEMDHEDTPEIDEL